jgi:hypothetical protein
MVRPLLLLPSIVNHCFFGGKSMEEEKKSRETKLPRTRQRILREHLARWEKVGGRVQNVKEFEATIALNAGRFSLRVEVGSDGSLSLSRL